MGFFIESWWLAHDSAPIVSGFHGDAKNVRGSNKRVVRIGTHGRGVVLMHEIPGITSLVLRLAKVIADRGYRVAVPSLSGTDGAGYRALVEMAELVKLCVNAEIAVFASNRARPSVD